MPHRERSRRDMTIVLAEDDEDDRELIREALQDSRLEEQMQFVGDGQELMDYLHRSSPTSEATPRPSIILLDLNMPRKDGREALAEIKADPGLRTIPVIVLTTSTSEQDIRNAYGLGASSYITKPVTHDTLTEVMEAVTEYWFDVVELPDRDIRA
jgi:CheY-like chemotaxis protein